MQHQSIRHGQFNPAGVEIISQDWMPHCLQVQPELV